MMYGTFRLYRLYVTIYGIYCHELNRTVRSRRTRNMLKNLVTGVTASIIDHLKRFTKAFFVSEYYKEKNRCFP